METKVEKITMAVIVLLVSFVYTLTAQIDSSYSSYSSYQDEKKKDEVMTIFGNKGSNGFMMGVSLGFADFNNQESIEIGGKIGGIIGHSFAIGGSGTAMLNMEVEQMTVSDTQMVSMNGGYGGMFLEPIILPKFPVHFSIPVFIGVGGIAVEDNSSFSDWDNWDDIWDGDTDAFLVFKPGFEVEFNIVKFMRINVGAYYRMFWGMNGIDGVKSNALDGFSGGMSLIFGKF